MKKKTQYILIFLSLILGVKAGFSQCATTEESDCPDFELILGGAQTSNTGTCFEKSHTLSLNYQNEDCFIAPPSNTSPTIRLSLSNFGGNNAFFDFETTYAMNGWELISFNDFELVFTNYQENINLGDIAEIFVKAGTTPEDIVYDINFINTTGIYNTDQSYCDLSDINPTSYAMSESLFYIAFCPNTNVVFHFGQMVDLTTATTIPVTIDNVQDLERLFFQIELDGNIDSYDIDLIGIPPGIVVETHGSTNSIVVNWIQESNDSITNDLLFNIIIHGPDEGTTVTLDTSNLAFQTSNECCGALIQSEMVVIPGVDCHPMELSFNDGIVNPSNDQITYELELSNTGSEDATITSFEFLFNIDISTINSSLEINSPGNSIYHIEGDIPSGEVSIKDNGTPITIPAGGSQTFQFQLVATIGGTGCIDSISLSEDPNESYVVIQQDNETCFPSLVTDGSYTYGSLNLCLVSTIPCPDVSVLSIVADQENICSNTGGTGITVTLSGNDVATAGPYDITVQSPDETYVQTVSTTEVIFNVLPIITSEYTITVTGNNSGGCVFSDFNDVITINVDTPITNVILPDESCSYSQTSLQVPIEGGIPPFIVTYSINNPNTTPITETSSSPNIFLDVPASAMIFYFFSVTDACNNMFLFNNGNGETVQIRMDPQFTADLVGDTTICPSETTNLIVNITDENGQPVPGQYDLTIDGYGSITNYESGDPIPVTPAVDTDYTLNSVSTIDGCAVSLGNQTVTVVLNPSSIADLVGDATLCPGETTNLIVNITDQNGQPVPGQYNLTIDGYGSVTNYESGDPIPVTPVVDTDYTLDTVSTISGCIIPLGNQMVTVTLDNNVVLTLGEPTIESCKIRIPVIVQNTTNIDIDDFNLSLNIDKDNLVFDGQEMNASDMGAGSLVFDDTLGLLTYTSPNNVEGLLFEIVLENSQTNLNGCLNNISWITIGGSQVNQSGVNCEPSFLVEEITAPFCNQSLGTASLSGSLSPICSGDSAELTLTINGGSGDYSVTSTPANLFMNPVNGANTITTVTLQADTQYTIHSITDNVTGCDIVVTNDTITVVIDGNSIIGEIKTSDTYCMNSQGIEDVSVDLGSENEMTTNGNYAFNGCFSNGMITPFRDENHGNGVSTSDIIKTRRYILGIIPLTAYELIAADVNQSETVTSGDMVEMRRVVLDLTDVFPNNTSWKFVDAEKTFNDPEEALLHLYPTFIEISPNDSRPSYDFIGVKIGDVDCNSNPGANILDPVVGKALIANEPGKLQIQIKAGDSFINQLGYQMGMRYNTSLLSLDQISAADLPGITASNFNAQADGTIRTLWDSPTGQAISLTEENLLFTLEFTVNAPEAFTTPVEELLLFDSSIIPIAAFDGDLKENSISLSYQATTPNEKDKFVLMALYHATNGTSWTNNTNWGSSLPLDQWHGVYTNADGRIRGITLSNNNLTGTLPSGIGDLENLDWLHIQNNAIGGVIPNEISQLPTIKWLFLSNNQFTSIPQDFSSAVSLEKLYASGNDLTGGIPTGLGKLANLTHVYLENNNLTGSIPSDLGQSQTLRDFRIQGSNTISGTIPFVLGDLPSIQILWLSGNSLSGEIPDAVYEMTGLNRLYLQSNQLNGDLKSQLANLTNLTHLYLNNNDFSGCFPSNYDPVLRLVANKSFADNSQLPGNGNFEAFCLDGSGSCGGKETSDKNATIAFGINVFPNPSKGSFSIVLDKILESFSIEIHNIYGNKVLHENFYRNNSVDLDISKYPTGLYFVKVITKEGTFTKNVIVE